MRILIAFVFAGSVLFTACEKEAPLRPMNETGSVMEYRGDEIEDGSTTTEGGGGITDGGHGSDYDNSSKNKKNKNN
ncbi:MAG: hypothetical protein ACOZCO_08485 [Bacteroidota bacterium]